MSARSSNTPQSPKLWAGTMGDIVGLAFKPV